MMKSLLTMKIEIKPFHLFHDINQRYMDPVHILLCWIYESEITEGYIFRRFLTGDRISTENKPLV